MPSKNSSSGSGKKKGNNNNKGTVDPSAEVISGTANASHCSRVTTVSVDTPRSSNTGASSSLVNNCLESSITAAMTNSSNPGSSSSTTNSVPLTPATTGQVVGAQGAAPVASVDNLR